ncbi:hypothetical protein PanWU01x14_029980 [Parasponia andersonii]|uniref:RNase H type-1 domain-containing protein n=1 Tax=Parasponia andersonii TaxID=3476 RepID=A0A2P5DUQ8_PARAD|nr:hypothetical protein PanWU01x14_029980 [Parasponia andersonii]
MTSRGEAEMACLRESIVCTRSRRGLGRKREGKKAELKERENGVLVNATSVIFACAYGAFGSNVSVDNSSWFISTDLCWSPPTVGALKLNRDASVYAGVDSVAGSLKFQGSLSPEGAEPIAIRESLRLCVDWEIPISVVESDASTVVNSIQSNLSQGPNAFIFDDIKSLFTLASYASRHFVPRTGNSVANVLASKAVFLPSDSYWVDVCPLFISSFASDDFEIY